MSTIVWLFLFAAYLQFAFCLPSTQTQSALRSSSGVEQNALTQAPGALTLEEQNVISRERKRLSTMISEGDKKHQKFLLQGSNRITKDILADPAVIAMNSADAKSERAVLAEYVKDSDDILNATARKCITRVLKDFFTFVNRHNYGRGNHTNTDDIWFKALKAHGMDQLEAEEAQLLNEIGYQYADEFEKYLSSLSPAGRGQEKDLVYVQETYLENKDIMDKASYGYRYVHFFREQQAEDKENQE